jgi:lipoprotein-releasing system permease protein
MWYLAIRQLLARKKQSALILIGIAMGAAGYVTISGMMLGFQEYILDQLVNNDGHIKISARDDVLNAEEVRNALFEKDTPVSWIIAPGGRRTSPGIEHPAGWTEFFSQQSDVLAFAPSLSAQALLTRAGTNISSKLIGIVPEAQKRVTKIESLVVPPGSLKEISHAGGRVIVGATLLQKLGGTIGDTVFLTAGQAEPMPFKVVGTYSAGIEMLDGTVMYVNLADAQRALRKPGTITELAVKLAAAEDAAEIAASWQNRTRDKVQSWDQASANILGVFKMQDIVRNSMTCER